METTNRNAAVSEALARLFTPRSVRDLTIWAEPRHPVEVGSVLARDTLAIPVGLLAGEGEAAPPALTLAPA